MQCEICGKNSAKYEIGIESAVMNVCQECKHFGTESIALSKKPFKNTTQEKQSFNQLDEGLDISQDFGKQIRKAREQRNLTIKELALKLFEKESTLNRIENGSLLPSNDQIKKIQKALKISIKQTFTKKFDQNAPYGRR